MAKHRPDKFPRWASHLVQSDINKEFNRYEPPPAKQEIGWDVGEIPPRQWVNYKANLTCQWLEYLDTEANKAAVVSRKEKLPKPEDNTGLIVYIKNIKTLAFSNGSSWQKIVTENL